MYKNNTEEQCEDCCHNYDKVFKNICDKCSNCSEKYTFDSLDQDMKC